jgi:hypothetical protein
MLLLAAHARDVTLTLFEGLQSLKDLDSIRSKIDDYVKYVTVFSLSAVVLKTTTENWRASRCSQRKKRGRGYGSE